MLKSFFLTSLALTVGLVLIALTSLWITPPVANGSTDYNNYFSVRYTSANAATSTVRLMNQQGTLGSVIVLNQSTATTSPTAFGLYDSSSTATSSATAIATFSSSTPIAVYTFDRFVANGLTLDIPTGFTGQYIVTYRY